DDATALRDGVRHGGDEVAERLAGARTRLDEEVLAPVEGALDRLDHRDLPVASSAAQVVDGACEQLGRGGGLRHATGAQAETARSSAARSASTRARSTVPAAVCSSA